MHRAILFAALAMVACQQDSGKPDDLGGGAGTDPTETTPPTSTTEAVYTVAFSLATDVALAGESVTWSGDVRDATGEAVEATFALASDLEDLEFDPTALTATVAGPHTITATVLVDDQVLDAEASLTVSPGAAGTLNLVLDDATIDAGATTGWTISSTDVYGNPLPDPAAVVSATELTVDGDQVGGTVVGFFEVTATLDAVSDTETLRVVAGPAAVLDLELDTVELEVGETATASVAVTDAYGNPSGAPYTLWVEGGRHELALERITFLEDGVFTVFAEVPSGPMDNVGPIIIDSSGPDLVITEPERGTFMDLPRVMVAGTAVDERDDVPPTVSTNGVVYDVDVDGAFSARIPIGDGIQVLETVAADLAGHTTTDKRAVLNGAWLDWGEEAPGGLHVRLDDGAGGLDVLSGLAESLVDADEIVAMIPDPAVDERSEWCEDIWLIGEVCYTLYAVTLWIDDARFGPINVDIDPLPTGDVRIELVIDDPVIDWSADVIASEIPIAGSGTITADDFIVRVDVEPRVVGGNIRLDVTNVYVTATNFNFDWDSWLQDVAEFFGLNLDTIVEGFVYDALETAVADEVPPLFEEVLNGLEIAESFPILDNTYTFEAVPADVLVDTFGITLVMDSTVAVDDWQVPYEGPGSFYVGYAAPDWVAERPGGSNIALSIDFVNQLLYGLWGGGAMALELSGDELGFGADELSLLFPDAVGDLYIGVDAMLPPVVVPGVEEAATLQLGDLRLTLTDETGAVLLDAYAHGTAPMSISSPDGRTFIPVIGDVDLTIDVVAPEVGASDVEELLVAIVPTFLPLLTDVLGAIELPTFEGFGLADVVVEPVGPDGGYLNLHGNLYEE
ncbi:MAG: hypothetical protein ACI8PZ_001223 [Myxococcota bacterium]|jgi:hypothetical protein